jgi:RNA polymerase sigma factor (sigma-70 family)
VTEAAFDQVYSVTHRVAAVRAAMIATLYSLPADARSDLEQEALLEVWRKRSAYDSRRGSWRTFAERVIANRMISLVRTINSERSGWFREDPLGNGCSLAAPNDGTELRVDVSQVLAGVSQLDRSIAVCLVGSSATQAGRRLGVSRAAIYRAIGRLRVAFTAAGLARRRGGPPSARRPNCASRIEVRRQEALA